MYIYKEFLISSNEFACVNMVLVNNCVTKMVKVSDNIITLHMKLL